MVTQQVGNQINYPLHGLNAYLMQYHDKQAIIKLKGQLSLMGQAHSH